MAELDYALRERLLTLARKRLENHPVALAAFENETAKPHGGAIGATVSLLDLSGFRMWAVMGDADKFNDKLLPVIDNWAEVHRAVEHLLPPRAEPVDPGAREPAAAPQAEVRALREALERGAEASARPGPVRPVSHATAHEAAILDALPRLGFDPLRLPPAPSGKRWPAKDAARQFLRLTPAQFDKAWLRLRDNKKIGEA